MHQSTVKWFDAKKGYGFIRHPNGGDDVFVHYSNIESDDDYKTLQADQEVRFEMNDGPKGLHAAKVTATEESPSGRASSNDPSADSFDVDPAEVDPTAEVDPIPTE